MSFRYERTKTLADEIQKRVAGLAEVVQTSTDKNLRDAATRLEMAIGSFQAEFEDFLDREGVEMTPTTPLRPEVKKGDYRLGDKVRFSGRTKPKYLGEDQVAGEVVGFGRERIIVKVEDDEKARRFRNVRAAVKPTLVEKV